MMSLPLARYPLFLQPAELGGIWLVELLLMLWNALLAQAIQQRQWLAFLTPTAVLILWIGSSNWLLWQARLSTPTATVRVAAIQPEYEGQKVLFSEKLYEDNLRRLLQQAQQMRARWAVLPESSETYFWSESNAPQRIRSWQQLAQNLDMRILIGVSRRLGEVGYNSAMAIAPASLPVFYNKVKLMPFTEYAPPPPVGEWLQVLGVARRSLQIGTHPHAIRLYGEPPVGTLICYESLFRWVGAKQVRDGAQWLVAMTNDQWLLGAGVREQHADYCVLRAIETRRWVVRASTVGPTGFFSPLGERRTVPIGRPEVAAYTIECFSGMTLYSRWGDFFGYGSLLAFAGVVLRRRARPVGTQSSHEGRNRYNSRR